MCYVQKFYYACGHYSHTKTRKCSDNEAGGSCSSVVDEEKIVTDCPKCVANAY